MLNTINALMVLALVSSGALKNEQGLGRTGAL